MKERRTQVAIIGSSPAELLLGHLRHLGGIDNIVIERRSRDHIEHRVRAGVIEYGVTQLLVESGA